jgi:hypothetical protein
VGVLNINIQIDGNCQKQLQDVLNTYNLTSTVNKPTRVTEKMATVIDHIITNIPAECYYTEVINSIVLDHFAQCININLTVSQQMRCYKESRNIVEANITGHVP